MAITEKDLENIFIRLDLDQDGKISFEEIYRDTIIGGSQIKSLTKTEFFRVLEEHDSDKDGSLTFEEFKKAVEKAGN